MKLLMKRDGAWRLQPGYWDEQAPAPSWSPRKAVGSILKWSAIGFVSWVAVAFVLWGIYATFILLFLGAP